MPELTLSWRRQISYRKQSIDFLCKSMDWFLYEDGLRHKRVKLNLVVCLKQENITFITEINVCKGYEINLWPNDTDNKLTSLSSLFGIVKLNKNANPDKYSYSGMVLDLTKVELFHCQMNCGKCPYPEIFWSSFFRILTEYEEMLRISLYSVWMRENTNHKNSDYGLFSRNGGSELGTKNNYIWSW